MRLSNYYIPVLRENPQEAYVKSHQLMLRAGMIRQISSGIYNWLPLGIKILNNVSNIIRHGLNEAGLIEVLMSCTQPAELWQKSGRYDDYGKEMLRIKDRHDHDMLFSPTNEEAITDLFKRDVKTYRDLPKNFYQIAWKFRDEIRPRFGLMRGREFLMKDAYSFDLDIDSARKTYEKMYETYYKILKSLGIKKMVAVSADSGAIGGDLSHEFHIIAETGESKIFYDKTIDDVIKENVLDIAKLRNLYAASDEKHDLSKAGNTELVETNGIEVGHIFYFGTKYTETLDLKVSDNSGKLIHPHMGSYGIGVSRIIAAMIEANHDDRGIIWPVEIAPFKISIINLKITDDQCNKLSQEIYDKLKSKNIEVLYDDVDDSAGSKFATHDLIGIPYQVIIGPKIASMNMVEFKERRTGNKEELSVESLLNKLYAI